MRIVTSPAKPWFSSWMLKMMQNHLNHGENCPFKTMLVGGFNHEWIIFHFIYGMSSFPLTNSFFSEGLVETTNQTIINQ